MDRDDKDERLFRVLNDIELDLHNISESLATIANEEAPPKADTATLTLIVQGVTMGNPVTVQLGLSGGVSHFVESVKASGVIVPAIGPVAYTSDNPSVATIDPSTGNWVPVAVGTANISALDQGNGLTDTVALTVIAAPPPVADTAVLTLVPNATIRR
jgi:hypothetical protein